MGTTYTLYILVSNYNHYGKNNDSSNVTIEVPTGKRAGESQMDPHRFFGLKV